MLKLRERPHTVAEIAKVTGFSKTTISYHLEKLERNGLVERVERGKWVYYRLTSQGLRRMKLETLATFASISVVVASLAALLARVLKFEEGKIAATKTPEAPGPTLPATELGGFPWIETSLAISATVALAIFLYLKKR